MDATEEAANREAQVEELEALEAIYGSEHCAIDLHASVVEVQLEPWDACVRALLPAEYPSRGPPLLELDDPSATLPPDAFEALMAEAERVHQEAPGIVMLFDLLEWLKDKVRVDDDESDGEESAIVDDATVALSLQQQEEDAALAAAIAIVDPEEVAGALEAELAQAEEALQRCRQDAVEGDALARVVEGIVHGPTFTEKRSVFQAHVAPVRSVEDVKSVMAVLLQNRKVVAATHNIMAYRINGGNGVWVQDHDEDGETAAGGRLLHLLQMTDATNVVVVVSRWYGGIKLGPDRFKIINNMGRNLLEACGFICVPPPKPAKGSKHKK